MNIYKYKYLWTATTSHHAPSRHGGSRLHRRQGEVLEALAASLEAPLQRFVLRSAQGPSDLQGLQRLRGLEQQELRPVESKGWSSIRVVFNGWWFNHGGS